jgi:hypothetical protein
MMLRLASLNLLTLLPFIRGERSKRRRYIRIATSRIWTCTPRHAVVLRCERGVVWVTQTGELGDVVLHAGERWEFRRRRKVVVTALEDAALAIGAISHHRQ